MSPTPEPRRARLLAYLVTLIASAATAVGVMELWRARLALPFSYSGGGDLLYEWMRVKATLRHGWYLHNPDLGMPSGADLHDFPDLGNLHLALIKGVGLVARDPGLALNLYFLATFPLTALIAHWALRRLGASPPLAVAGGLLYAFVPGHFVRGEPHLGIASYFMIPILVVACLWIAEGRSLRHDAGGARLGFASRYLASPGFGLVVACAVTSAGKVYHSFFGAFFLLVAGALGAIRMRSFRPLLRSATLVAVLTGGVLVNLLPNFLYYQRHGRTDLVVRPAAEAEIYGLKLTQLLLPAHLHRFFPLAKVRARHDQEIPPLLLNENHAATLGGAASAGFLLLLAGLFGLAPPSPDPRALRALGRLNLAGLLLATVGGFSTLFAVFVSSQIRAYNRISFFLAFFGIAATILVAEELGRRLAERHPTRLLARHGRAVLATGLAVVGLWDQTPPSITVPPYDADVREAESDGAFVRALEAALPAGAMVFQLPYEPFPEHTFGVGRAKLYDSLRPYLNSRSLRWSAGAMYGRETDRWQRRVTRLRPEAMPPALHAAGFAGLTVDTWGYDDSGEKVLRRLRRVLGAETATSADGRWIFFPLTGSAGGVDRDQPGAAPAADGGLVEPAEPPGQTAGDGAGAP